MGPCKIRGREGGREGGREREIDREREFYNFSVIYLPLSLLSFSFFFQIDYFNNKIICDLVEQPHSGIIALLDEACFMVGTVTDKVSSNLKCTCTYNASSIYIRKFNCWKYTILCT